MRRRVVGLLPWIAAVALMAGLGAATRNERAAPERGDDGCPREAHGSHRIALVDACDSVHAAILDQIIARLVRLALSGGPDDRFSLFVMGGGADPDVLREFSGCFAANRRGAGDIFLKKKAEEIAAPVRQALSGLAETERGTTPLLEAIDIVLHRRDVFESETAELWIVSDFLQHSSRLSHYRGDARLPEMTPPPARLAGIRLLYLPRPGSRHLQTPEHGEGWVAFFTPLSETPPQLEKF